MARVKNHGMLVRQLKKQVTALQKREEKARRELMAALHKVRAIGSTYKRKLAVKAKIAKNKMVAAQAATYKRAAADIGKHLERKVAAKKKALTSAIVSVEKRFVDKLTKAIHSQAKKAVRRSRASVKKIAGKKTTMPRKRARKSAGTHRRVR